MALICLPVEIRFRLRAQADLATQKSSGSVIAAKFFMQFCNYFNICSDWFSSRILAHQRQESISKDHLIWEKNINLLLMTRDLQNQFRPRPRQIT